MAETSISNSPESLAQDACRWLVDQICAKQTDPQGTYSLALSGGSTPKRLYQLLAEIEEAAAVDWKRVLLIWGDERNVPADSPESNYRMVKENLLDKVAIPANSIFAMPEPGGDAADSAILYEQLLRERLGESTPFPSLDCVLLGMGDDVHTASLFPETSALGEQDRWVVANWVEKLDCWRMTLTAPFINSAKNVVFLVAGAGKRDALKTVWDGPFEPLKYPSQLIKPKGKLRFMVDETAVAGLTPPGLS